MLHVSCPAYIGLTEPPVQVGSGALHLARGSGYANLVKILVGEFGISPDIRDNESILTVHELKPYIMRTRTVVMG